MHKTKIYDFSKEGQLKTWIKAFINSKSWQLENLRNVRFNHSLLKIKSEFSRTKDSTMNGRFTNHQVMIMFILRLWYEFSDVCPPQSTERQADRINLVNAFNYAITEGRHFYPGVLATEIIPLFKGETCRHIFIPGVGFLDQYEHLSDHLKKVA